MKKALIVIAIVALAAAAAALLSSERTVRLSTVPTSATSTEAGEAVDAQYEIEASEPVPVSATETQALPSDATALGGYDVLIADRGNNRIIEVTPDKQIVWEYDFSLPRPGLGADDAFFTDGGKTLIVSLEEWQVIEQIDYATKQVVWQYGIPDKPGSAPGQLHTPDDAYKLPNGDVTVADISNCRVIEISPDKKIVRQYGKTGVCGDGPGLLNKPNGDTPLANGHTFVSNIMGHSLMELDENWNPLYKLKFPLRYPSDPQPTRAGNILIAGYTDPGRIMELQKDGTVVWDMNETSGPTRLKRPSLAIELPNGNIMANDDENHRVIVIDKKTKQIVWQYGVTGKPGRAPGQLNVPDGMDIILRKPEEAAPSSPPPGPVRTVGSVSRHPTDFVGKTVTLSGTMIRTEGDYIIISDETGGAVGLYDLPVVGDGIDIPLPGKTYLFTGTLVQGGLKASNGNPYHLELTRPPQTP